jgi:hypothetical protein
MSGNLDQRTETIPASGVVSLPPANFIFVLSSTGNTKLQLSRLGASVRGANIENYGSSNLAGLQIYRTQRWDFATFTGTPGVVVTFIYGTTDIREDGTLFTQQIATVSGIVTTQVAPAAAISTPATNAVVTASATTIAANLARRRITFVSPSTNTGSVFLQAVGAGAGRGIELQPGTFVEIDNTAAIDIRNDSGATQTVGTFEET